MFFQPEDENGRFGAQWQAQRDTALDVWRRKMQGINKTSFAIESAVAVDALPAHSK